jgi:hypothetical protein
LADLQKLVEPTARGHPGIGSTRRLTAIQAATENQLAGGRESWLAAENNSPNPNRLHRTSAAYTSPNLTGSAAISGSRIRSATRPALAGSAGLPPRRHHQPGGAHNSRFVRHLLLHQRHLAAE